MAVRIESKRCGWAVEVHQVKEGFRLVLVDGETGRRVALPGTEPTLKVAMAEARELCS